MLLSTVLIFSLLSGAYSLPSGLPPFPLAGCGKALPKGQFAGNVYNVTLASGGQDRSYLVSIPPTYHQDIPTPLILSYHGGNRDAEDQLQLDQLTDVQFNTASFVIYPQGINVRAKT